MSGSGQCMFINGYFCRNYHRILSLFTCLKNERWLYLYPATTVMIMKNATPATVDEYITGFPEETQAILEQVRATVKKAAPGAKEVISYSMPALRLNGILVYYAAYKNHIGFYPTATGIEEFKKELSVYKGAKGSVQFPIDQPMPLALITKIVKFRVKEDKEQAAAKAKKK